MLYLVLILNLMLCSGGGILIEFVLVVCWFDVDIFLGYVRRM